MEFVFVNGKIEEVPIDPLPLSEALAFLEELNDYLIENHQENVYYYDLFDEKDKVFQGFLRLPQQNFCFYEEIHSQVFQSEDMEMAEKFWEWLEPKLLKECNQLKKQKQDSLQIQERQEKSESTEKQTEKEVEKGEFKGKRSLFYFAKGLKKRGLLVGEIFILAILLFFGVKLFFMEQIQSYDELLTQGEYVEAGKLYPKKIEAIESYLYEKILNHHTEKNIDQLVAFNQTYETVKGSFHLAIFQGKYQEATAIYEKHVQELTDQESLTFAGYAYLKQELLDKAEAIAEKQSGIELKEKIYKYKQLKDAIDEKNNRLKELEKGGSKNREEAEKVATEKFKLQEDLLNL